jgi:uncharacterized protein (TIGR02271 family)
MPDITEVTRWKGQTVVGSDGEKIGKIEDIYLDQQTEQPEWLAVKTGLFGGRISFVPLAEASADSDDIRVPYGKDQVKEAPHAEPDGELSPQEEERLYRHYGREYGGGGDASDARGTVGRDVSGPETDDAMTRSEEELRVGTERRETGRARLKKHVVTENVETTVPVQREEVRVEREPITDANAGQARSGPDISEEEHEVTLHEEEVVTEKRAVPKERVRLDKETVTEDQTVSEEVRKEQIEADGDTTKGKAKPRRRK